jgi:hypothetical protein
MPCCPPWARLPRGAHHVRRRRRRPHRRAAPVGGAWPARRRALAEVLAPWPRRRPRGARCADPRASRAPRPRWAAPSAATRACWPRPTRPAASATPRTSRRPSSSCAARPSVELSEISCVAVDNGPGAVHRPAGGRGVGQGHRLRPAGAHDRVSRASTCWRSRCASQRRRIVAVIDARRNEVFWAFYRQVPGGIQRVSEPGVCPRRPGRRAAGHRARTLLGRRRPPLRRGC